MAVAYGYYIYRQHQQDFINTNYFRVLSEATAKLNENISQLITLTDYYESDANIRSLFPSFKRLTERTKTSLTYMFDGQQLSVFPKGSSATHATVEVDDLLPSPNDGFSLYLLVGENNKVLSSTGDSSTLSIVNVEHISQLIAKSQNIDWSSLASGKKDGKNEDSNKLPGFSHYLDLNLTSSAYRLFIYPFQFQSKIEFTNGTNGKGGQLYMLGVLPKSRLDAQENQRWNLSLLSLTLALLLFAWVMLRLFMLSNNQPVGELFYKSTMICSYMLFVMTIALLLAYGEKSIEQNFKFSRAESLMKRLNYDVDQELVEIAKNLVPYQKYYQTLIRALNAADLDDQGAVKDVTELARFVLAENDTSINTTAFSTREGSYQKSNLAKLHGSISSRILWPLSFINLFGEGVNIHSGNDFFAESYSPATGFDPSSKLLSVVLLDNTDGINHLPMFHFIESNKEPTSYNLAHREYFKNVRDQRGWHGEFGLLTDPEDMPQDKQSTGNQACKQAHRIDNFYIQRLRNINNGLRGTTLALPLNAQLSKISPTSNETCKSIANAPSLINSESIADAQVPLLNNYILVADLALTSLTMTELKGSDDLLDMTFMVVDRDSGEVLFHLDDDRTLIENLFNTGQGSEDISHRIRAGLDGSWTQGYYHGVAGQYSIKKMPINQWALVVFMPDESLDSYMTNLFLFISITLAFLIISVATTVTLIRRFSDTGKLKQYLAIPLVIDRRKLMVFSSIYFSSLYLGFWLGSAIERNTPEISATTWLSLASALTCILWGYFEYVRFYQLSRQAQGAPINYNLGAILLCSGFLLFGFIVIQYLQQVGMGSANGLNWYYTQKLYPARLNQESKELRKLALHRYPNSVTDKQVPPLDLLPISQDWSKQLSSPDVVNDFMQPKDVMYFSKLVNTTDLASWLARYVAGQSKSSGKSPRDLPRPDSIGYSPLWSTLYFVVICALWILFNRRLLAVRLFGSPQFLRHINKIVNRPIPATQHCPASDLQIDLVDSPQAGLDLALAIQQWQTKPAQQLSKLDDLFSQCTMLKEVATLQNPLPNMKIHLLDCEGNLALHLWDMEASLEDSIQRALLLRLLNQLKSLKMTGQLSCIVLHWGFHSFQRLCLKDTLLTKYQEQRDIRQHEYFSWAECLMDFTVRVPDDLQEHLDVDFLQHEICAMPILQFLHKELPQGTPGPTSHFNLMRWVYLQDWQKNHAEWASINYLLLKVEALYRFKWESCSAAEKLALYYLAQNKRVNPTNVQMLEHLALNGLIKVKRGRIHIVNRSFAYFVKYAEDEETLEKLVEQGNVGNWQDYRMPITLLILMAIGTIAITSGNSLYMIVASAMGVLGTVGSLTNSANLIRNNLQK
jgi:hypothetical protein